MIVSQTIKIIVWDSLKVASLHREDLGLPLQYHKRETVGKNVPKRGEENMNAGCLGMGKNKNKVILCTIPTKRFPVWTTGLHNSPTDLRRRGKK